MNLRRDSSQLMHRPFVRAYGLLIGFFLLKLALHLGTSWKYGFHRDEFYYILGGRYLDWGYVDHPPFTPFLARVATSIFGLSLSGLRLFPALAGAIVVVLTMLIVRRIGGQWWAQIAAGLAVLLMPMYLGANTLFQTVSFDQLWWMLISYLLITLITANNPRIWLLIGLAFGIGWQTKYTIALFGVGLVVGIVATPLAWAADRGHDRAAESALASQLRLSNAGVYP
jgi:4-amino-4-deoxy-L-arabinose transferase-like glycosyltransferase